MNCTKCTQFAPKFAYFRSKIELIGSGGPESLWKRDVDDGRELPKVGLYCEASPCRPVESHSGARENIIAGPYTPPFCRSRDRDVESAEREEMWGEVSPQHPTRGSGSVVIKLPQRVRGRVPAENRFYAYFRSERSHLEHHFQYF